MKFVLAKMNGLKSFKFNYIMFKNYTYFIHDNTETN